MMESSRSRSEAARAEVIERQSAIGGYGEGAVTV
jgi:hypothetical protein